jgi:hypothetical protein
VSKSLTRIRRSNVAKSRMNCVEWHEAENMLTSVKGDVFAIFDCCNAGRLCHTRGPALWEVLGACSEDQTTQPPGHDSFTQALIWALKELRQKPNGRFSTSELRRKIKEAPFLPRNQQPPLKNRTNDSLPHIVIAPCSKADKVDNLVTPISSEENQVEVAQYFDIRLHATVVTDELIEKTAEVLNELMSPNSESPMPIDRISFLGSGSFNRVHRFALSWLEKTRVKNSRSASEQPQKTKKKALSCPTLHIPAQTTAHTNLEVPPHSATSDKSVSSNATTCDEGLQEANPPLIFAEPTSIYKSSDHGVSIDVNTATIPATAVIESSASDRDLELDNDVATSTSKLQTSTRPPRHEQNKDQDNREKGNLAAAKRSSNFRQAGSISSFLKSKVLRIKTQDT